MTESKKPAKQPRVTAASAARIEAEKAALATSAATSATTASTTKTQYLKLIAQRFCAK